VKFKDNKIDINNINLINVHKNINYKER